MEKQEGTINSLIINSYHLRNITKFKTILLIKVIALFLLFIHVTVSAKFENIGSKSLHRARKDNRFWRVPES